MYRKRLGSRPMTISLLALMALTTGCGFIVSHGPPEGHEQLDYFTCTESNTGPILDVIFASLNVISALAVAADPNSNFYIDSDQAIVSGLLVGCFGARRLV